VTGEFGRGVIVGGLGFVAVSSCWAAVHCLLSIGPWPCQRKDRADA